MRGKRKSRPDQAAHLVCRHSGTLDQAVAPRRVRSGPGELARGEASLRTRGGVTSESRRSQARRRQPGERTSEVSDEDVDVHGLLKGLHRSDGAAKVAQERLTLWAVREL